MSKSRIIAPAPQPVPPGAELVFEPFPKQAQYIEAALSGRFQFLLYGGAIRGGKSYVTLATIILLCKIYPGSRWAVVRADLPRIRRNVVPTFDKLRPRHFVHEVNRTTWTARCTNGSEILFVPESLRDDPEGLKWRGFEVNGLVLEEANELGRATYDAAIERAGTWVIPGAKVQPPSLVLSTCNPGQSWVKEEYHDPYIARTLRAPKYFLQADAEDNPHVPESLKKQWEMLPPHIYRRYVKGDWNVTDDPLQVVPYEALHARLLFEPPDVASIDGAEALGVDYGGAGGRTASGDLTVFAHGRGPVLYECDGHAGLSQGAVATMIMARMQERGIDAQCVAVDVVGEGSGVWGNLHDAGITVRAALAGGAPWDIDMTAGEKAVAMQYSNLKAQMWWMMRRAVTDPESELAIINHPALVQDLLSVRYKISAERKITIEDKPTTKARIGRSPDHGDAAVMWNLVRQARSVEAFEYLPASARDAAESLWGDKGGESLWSESYT